MFSQWFVKCWTLNQASLPHVSKDTPKSPNILVSVLPL